MDNDSVSLIIIILCVVMSAYFSATETAFSSLNRIRIKNLAEKGNKKARLVLKLSENYDSLLSTILIGNNIVNIASASLATVLFVKILGDDLGPSISTAVTTIVVLVFAEVSPKSIAKENPEKFAMFSAPVLNIFVKILTPFNYLFSLWKKLLSRIFKTSEDDVITEEEFLSIMDEATEDGSIDKEENILIRNALDFTEQEVIDVLTPRKDVTAIDKTATKKEIAEVFFETSFSRLPVYDETIDNIIGIIYQKDFHNLVYHTNKEISEIIRPVLYVHKSKKISSLLKELQQKKMHFAVVVDEFGGTIGIVTLEDILEDLVGEIWDEYDEVNLDIEVKSENEIIASGKANVEELFEILQLEIDKNYIDFVTVNGWVMKELKHIPQKGEVFDFQDYHITIISVKNNCVDKLIINKKGTD